MLGSIASTSTMRRQSCGLASQSSVISQLSADGPPSSTDPPHHFYRTSFVLPSSIIQQRLDASPIGLLQVDLVTANGKARHHASMLHYHVGLDWDCKSLDWYSGGGGGTFLVTLPGPPAQITPLLPTSPCPPPPLLGPLLPPTFFHCISTSQSRYQHHVSPPMHPSSHNAVCASWLPSPRFVHECTHNVFRIPRRRHRQRIYRLVKSSRHLPLLAGWVFFYRPQIPASSVAEHAWHWRGPIFHPNLINPPDHHMLCIAGIA